MPESAISLKNRTLRDTAIALSVPFLITRPPIQRKNCWTPQNNTDFIDTVVRGWSCSPIFIIQHETDSDETDMLDDHVFDGAHRIECVIGYMNDQFPLVKVSEMSPLYDYIGKRFSELPLDIRNRIRNYSFTINIIDSVTANDKDSLKLLWERLNNSGKKLNDFELALPVIRELNTHVLKPSLELFLGTELFVKTSSERGEAEKLLQIILALSESDICESHLKDFTSKKNLIKRWQTACLGDTMAHIKNTTMHNKDKWLGILKRARDYLDRLSEANCFVDESGKHLLESAHRGTELVFLLGRLTYHFPKPDLFKRVCPAIAAEVKKKYFTTIVRDDAGRNGLLQRRILRELDVIILSHCQEIPRRTFTTAQITKKLEEQNHICAQCADPILSHHTYHGDHIVPWILGGDSTDENCQVSHKRCNLVKGKRTDLNKLPSGLSGQL